LVLTKFAELGPPIQQPVETQSGLLKNCSVVAGRVRILDGRLTLCASSLDEKVKVNDATASLKEQSNIAGNGSPGLLRGTPSNGGFRILGLVLSNDERFWRHFIYFAALLGFLRGVRLPNLWAATQAQLDYSFGFVRRGFFGEALSLLHIHHYVPFVLVSYGILAAFIAFLWRYTLCAHASTANFIVASVFFSSLAFTYVVHLVGYLDIVLECLLLGTLFLSNVHLRAIVALPVAIAGTLIHEMFLVLCLPLLLLDLLLWKDSSRFNRKSSRSVPWLYGTLLTGVTLFVVLSIARHPSLTQPQFAAYLNMLSHKADFPIRGGVEILGRSIKENSALTGMWMHSRDWRHNQIDGILEFGPCIAFYLYLGLRLVRNRFQKRSQPILAAMFVITALSPLCLNLFGIDIYRWFALASLSSFVALSAISRYAGAVDIYEASSGVPPWLRNVAVVLIALNLSSGSGLMDGYGVNTYPFMHLGRSVIDAIHSRQIPQPK